MEVEGQRGGKSERVGYLSKTQTQMSAKALRLLSAKVVGQCWHTGHTGQSKFLPNSD